MFYKKNTFSTHVAFFPLWFALGPLLAPQAESQKTPQKCVLRNYGGLLVASFAGPVFNALRFHRFLQTFHFPFWFLVDFLQFLRKVLPAYVRSTFLRVTLRHLHQNEGLEPNETCQKPCLLRFISLCVASRILKIPHKNVYGEDSVCFFVLHLMLSFHFFKNLLQLHCNFRFFFQLRCLFLGFCLILQLVLTFVCEKMLPALVAEHYFGISLTALRLNKSKFSIDLAPKFHLKRLLGRTLASPILIASAERAEKTVVPGPCCEFASTTQAALCVFWDFFMLKGFLISCVYKNVLLAAAGNTFLETDSEQSTFKDPRVRA